jgi:hypothetical protein
MKTINQRHPYARSEQPTADDVADESSNALCIFARTVPQPMRTLGCSYKLRLYKPKVWSTSQYKAQLRAMGIGEGKAVTWTPGRF